MDLIDLLSLDNGKVKAEAALEIGLVAGMETVGALMAAGPDLVPQQAVR